MAATKKESPKNPPLDFKTSKTDIRDVIQFHNTPDAKEHLDFLMHERAQGIKVTLTAVKGEEVKVQIEAER